MSPESRVFIPKETWEKFKADLPGKYGGSIDSVDSTTPKDFRDEIEFAAISFTARLHGLLIPNCNTETEERINEGYKAIIPHLSDKASFQKGDFNQIPDAMIDDLRRALVNRFESSIDREPEKIIQGNISAAMGISQIEMIMLNFGLEDGRKHSYTDIGRKMHVEPDKVRRDIVRYFDEIKREINGSRRYSTPLRDIAHQIRRVLETHS